MNSNKMNLEQINSDLKSDSPLSIVRWAIEHSKSPILTTNFGPYEASIIHLVTQVKPDIKVLWCDTGYNTSDTYRHAKELIESFNLNMHIVTPELSKGFRDCVLGIPELNTKDHQTFTNQVKITPFNKAFKQLNPDLWITNIRKGQTANRSTLDTVSLNDQGIIKVSPFFNWTDVQLDNYLKSNQLPNQSNYYDPTKIIAHRECGIHL